MDENENESISNIHQSFNESSPEFQPTDSASDDDTEPMNIPSSHSNSFSLQLANHGATSSANSSNSEAIQHRLVINSPISRPLANGLSARTPANQPIQVGVRSKTSHINISSSDPIFNFTDRGASSQRSNAFNDSLANTFTVKSGSPAKNHVARNRYHHVANRLNSNCIGSGNSSRTPDSGMGSSSSIRVSPVEVASLNSTHIEREDNNSQTYVVASSNSGPSIPFFSNVALGASSNAENSAHSADSSTTPTTNAPSPSENHNWQSSKMTIPERMAFLFNNEILSDVKFIVGRGSVQQRVPAHKFVLSIGSAVFHAMFYGSMASDVSEIELTDVEPVAFFFLLKFLYTDEAHIGPDTVMTTLYTAKKYAVPALESQCVEFLKCNLSAENAFMLLSQARLFDEQQLADMCLDSIDKCTTEAINAEGFVDIDIDTLCSVLRRDTLSIKECKLFQAVIRWADAECQRQQIASTAENKRMVLGEAISLIRFPLMTVEEFASCAQNKVLLDKEIVNLFFYFTCNPKVQVEYGDKPRCYLSGCEYVVNRFRQVDCRWGYSGTPDKIRFRVNQKIRVVGLGLYGSTHPPQDYQVSIQITDDESGKICGDNDTSFSSDGSSTTFRIMFREPVEIRPHNYYTASSTISGADSYYGTKGMRKSIIDTSDGKIVFHFQHSPGNNNGTSVEDGQIPEFIFYTC